MPLTDSTQFFKNKENMTQLNKLGVELEQKMQLPMKSNVEAIQEAVNIFTVLISLAISLLIVVISKVF